MKKVWVLEKFETPEEMMNMHKSAKEMYRIAQTAEELLAAREFADALSNKILKNPNGYWFGFEGKTNYKQFCDCAKAAINRNPDKKFRVVEGEIPDDAQYWLGYKIMNINDGVYKYLMATK